MERLRVELHVRPGASRPSVGGVHDGALVVRVVEPAEAGRATEAALAAVARALGVSPTSVTLVRGTSSRRKVIDVGAEAGEIASVAARLERLRDGD